MRSIEPRLLQAFLAVAREGNVSRAAQRLHRSQPAVSLQLRELSSQLGLELFRRTSTGMMLTPAGASLLVPAERALDGLADVAQLARRINGGIQGPLRVGTILDPNITRLGTFLHELVALAPGLRPELQHGMSGTVLAKLESREIDVGYCLGEIDTRSQKGSGTGPGARTPLFQHEVLTRYTYRVVAPAGWRLQVQGLDWPELVKLPWIGTPAQSVHSRLLGAVLRPLGLELTQVAMVDQEASMLALVRSGVGLALARDSVAIEESQREGLVIADRVSLECALGFVCLSKLRDAPHIDIAWQAMARVWRS